MRNKLIYSLFYLSILLSCGGPDVGFVSEVKIFSPQWMDLSERASFLKQNFKLTSARYEQDVSQLSASIENAGATTRSKLYGRRAEYRKVVAGRDKLAQDFKSLYKRFEEQTFSFNKWEKKLMGGSLSKEKAKADFLKYKTDLKQLELEFSGLRRSLKKNVAQHNKILAQMVDMLGLYTNLDIDIK